MIDHTHAAIPDWLVRAASWIELLVAVALAVAFLYVLWGAMRFLRYLVRRRPH